MLFPVNGVEVVVTLHLIRACQAGQVEQRP